MEYMVLVKLINKDLIKYDNTLQHNDAVQKYIEYGFVKKQNAKIYVKTLTKNILTIKNTADTNTKYEIKTIIIAYDTSDKDIIKDFCPYKQISESNLSGFAPERTYNKNQ